MIRGWDCGMPGMRGDPPREVFSNQESVVRAARFLDAPGIVTVEDWGCGLGGFKLFLRPEQRYLGVDGSKSPFADRLVDLVDYRCDPDAVHLRHVLEHNPKWDRILDNALKSFRKQMVLSLFTPRQENPRHSRVSGFQRVRHHDGGYRVQAGGHRFPVCGNCLEVSQGLRHEVAIRH